MDVRMRLALAALLFTESAVGPALQGFCIDGGSFLSPLGGATYAGCLTRETPWREAWAGSASSRGCARATPQGRALGDRSELASRVEPCAAAAAGATEAKAGGPTRPERGGGSAPTADVGAGVSPRDGHGSEAAPSRRR